MVGGRTRRGHKKGLGTASGDVGGRFEMRIEEARHFTCGCGSLVLVVSAVVAPAPQRGENVLRIAFCAEGILCNWHVRGGGMDGE